MASGYGFDDETKKMLGEFTWGDVHHPSLSETDGDYDGRWLFVNEMNGRLARIDLRDFKTKQIFGPVPNISGNHASAFVTPNTEYSMMASRFSIPIPKGTPGEIEDYAKTFKGLAAGIKIDPKTGDMSLGWEIMLPPFDYDLGDAGKKVSDGWVVTPWSLPEPAIHLPSSTSTKSRRPSAPGISPATKTGSPCCATSRSRKRKWVREIDEIFERFAAELEEHMMTEEAILFPAIRRCEAGTCGSGKELAAPIRVMEQDHETAGDDVSRMRTLSNGFAIPEGACMTFRAMLDGLRELDEDLQVHVHKENNVLFPRVLALVPPSQ
jgi:hypothetical protein